MKRERHARVVGALVGVALALAGVTAGAKLSPAEAQPTQPAAQSAPRDLDKIRDEGLNRSQVMAYLSYLTDVIGGRLTNSPSMKRANEWTRDTMAGWGMATPGRHRGVRARSV